MHIDWITLFNCVTTLINQLNSMNCLMEAIGIALPGNGSILAVDKERKNLVSLFWQKNCTSFYKGAYNE